MQSATLYLPAGGPLHRLHPLSKLTLSLCLMVAAVGGPGILLPAAIFLLVLLPVALWGRVSGLLLARTVSIVAPLGVMIVLIQGFFSPLGVTPLFHAGLFTFTLEGGRYAFLVVSRLLVIVAASMLLLLTTHPGLLMAALCEKGLPPSLAYIISSTLQIIPRLQQKALMIMDAQRARGLETEGTLLRRARALLPLLAPLVFASLIEVEERAMALEARAFRAPVRKTIWRLPADTVRQRWLRRLIILLTLMLLGTRLWL